MPRLFLSILFSVLALSSFAQGEQSEYRKSIYFGGGSYYVDEVQIEELKTFLTDFEKIEQYQVNIFSHTDPIGGKEFNEWLSGKRSDAVYQLLLENLVPSEIIHIRDFGYTNPLYTNYSNQGRRMNRRVDVILVPIVF